MSTHKTIGQHEAIARIKAELLGKGKAVPKDVLDLRERAGKVKLYSPDIITSRISKLERARSDRTCVVVDFDMFYVAVELLDQPHLVETPVVVTEASGGRMVAAANYIARQYGIHSNLPLWVAEALCKRAKEFGMEPVELVVLTQNKEKQKECAAKAMEIYIEYDPTVVSKSPDEAKLELGPYLIQKYGQQAHADDVVSEIRERVKEATGLTVSAGIASNFLLAKMASDKRKPDGQFSVQKDQIATFLADMPIRKFHGIGDSIEEKLKLAFNIHTGADLQARIRLLHAVRFEEDKMIKLSIGWDNSVNVPPGQRKSILKSSTFTSTSDMGAIKSTLSLLCDELAKELQSEKKYASTVTVKYKLKDDLVEKPVSRSVSCRTSWEFLKVAFPIIHAVKGEIRMVGVVASELVMMPTMTMDAFFPVREATDNIPIPNPKRLKTAPKQTSLAMFFGW